MTTAMHLLTLDGARMSETRLDAIPIYRTLLSIGRAHALGVVDSSVESTSLGRGCRSSYECSTLYIPRFFLRGLLPTCPNLQLTCTRVHEHEHEHGDVLDEPMHTYSR